MAIDSTLPVRRALLTLLNGNAGVTAIAAAPLWYPQAPTPPTGWRAFGHVGSLSGIPIRGSCLDGQQLIGAVHGFAKPRLSGTLVVETAEDHAARLGAAIAAALDGKRVGLPRGTARIAWTGSQLLVDGGEPDAFHTVQNFRIRVMSV